MSKSYLHGIIIKICHHLPYIYHIDYGATVRFYPSPGDEVKLKDSTERVVDRVLRVSGTPGPGRDENPPLEMVETGGPKQRIV